MTTPPSRSWGRWPRLAQTAVALRNRFDAPPPLEPGQTCLPWGMGRSYGDVCQNAGGTLWTTTRLDHLIAFDAGSGIVECESGVQLATLIDAVLPQGWFVPVTPGTAFVTVGGAIANDVHGKNHHRLGTFGSHVLGFELLRSDGTRRWCSPEENADWFGATIGGLGLTGLILRVRLRLRRVPGAFLAGQSLRFGGLGEFFALSAESDRRYEYTVAWLDCAGRHAGRGIFMRANHSERSGRTPASGGLRMPFAPPFSLVGRHTLALFNQLYFHRPAAQQADALWHYRPFFHPLDGIGDWNRMYGPAGFFQFQCAVPPDAAEAAIGEMLREITRAASGSFLAVLKMFGSLPSPGWLSFPRPGATLALDFPNRGKATLDLLDRLEAITVAARGAIYPAKDACMSAAAFQSFYPRWSELRAMIDPQFSSSFWRRVTEPAA